VKSLLDQALARYTAVKPTAVKADASKYRGKNGKFPQGYIDFMDSAEWEDKKREVKSFYFKLGLLECANCGTKDNLHCHHKRYPADWNAPVEAYVKQPVQDFTWLCEGCHGAFHAYKRRK
jgi:hypothetical protein